MRARTLITRSAVTVLFAAAATIGMAPTASAATCSGSSCDGKNPSTYCQDDAETVKSVTLGQATLQLRYSASCRAAWGRITNASYDTRSQFTPSAGVHRNSDGREYTCAVATTGTSCFTLMVNDANVTSYAFGEWDSGAQVYSDRTGSY
ncbi:DUF2690 domain-containing protein [Streptomyces sp. NPDC058751]|uniref:DUF2690 domain-containing protein n=1 Tax=Streptomyces sp. NPDC058751 TaxID=3346623 RepID=UPI003692D832